MIEVVNVSKMIKKNNFRNIKVEILNNVSFRVRENKIVSIVGPNGAGKSTSIKIIMKFVRATSGSVKVRDGVKIGYLPENPYYYDYLTFRELLRFSTRAFKVDSRSAARQIGHLSERVGLSHCLDKRLRTFSKGMVQRAGLAAAIVHDPDLIILDEPMSGLDPLGRRMVFDLITDLKSQGKTVLFCSHILSDVERLCDEVVIMHKGSVHKELAREDLIRAQKQTEIVVSDDPFVRKQLLASDMTFEVTDGFLNVYVLAGEINNALNILQDNNIDIVMIKPSEITLEKIFEEITV